MRSLENVEEWYIRECLKGSYTISKNSTIHVPPINIWMLYTWLLLSLLRNLDRNFSIIFIFWVYLWLTVFYSHDYLDFMESDCIISRIFEYIFDFWMVHKCASMRCFSSDVETLSFADAIFYDSNYNNFFVFSEFTTLSFTVFSVSLWLCPA